MWHLFEGASSFEGDLSNWDVSSVVNMEAMFQNTPFNGSVGSSNVSAVSTIILMFSDAINLDQDLSNWDVGSVIDFTDMFNNTPQLSDDNKCFIHNLKLIETKLHHSCIHCKIKLFCNIFV